ncbi:aaa family atpase [Pyrenophora tritici-repentis]|nr:aaa family atpase [Pyrenophora tritici-repentis]KAI0581954.1 aaa family atpase [Pyrenophora tritici-repentis]KAI0589624.1 aaa family atpase [Pyrenophora tritici-repentis]KAI1574564.1 SpoVK ATPase of the AAA+ class [Pyrenophora tritici-repentis]KAI1581926.1 SpoVK ATPase of the AAA+ class [Pyrenophora tritici-repentis]
MNDQDSPESPAHSIPSKTNKKLSDTSTSSPVIVPTPSVASDPDDISLQERKMESSQDSVETQKVETVQQSQENQSPVSPSVAQEPKKDVVIVMKKSDKKGRRGSQKSKRKVKETPVSEASSSDSSSEAEENKKSRRKALRAKAKKRKNKKLDSSSENSDSDTSSSQDDTESESEDEDLKRKRAKSKAKRKSKKSKNFDSFLSSSDQSSDDEEAALPASPPEPPLPGDTIDTQVTKFSALLQGLKAKQASVNAAAAAAVVATTKLEQPVKKNALEFKRVDQVFDMKIHDWKLVESNTVQKDEFDCVFTVRRRLNWEGKYQETQLDIKSKLLRNALQEVFKDCKSISLVEDIPQIDPHTLFHYYDELKNFTKKTLKTRLKKAKRSKEQKRLKHQIQQCKLLLSYIDEDYTATRKALKPMLKAGTITYDLVWALFKPNTIAFTPTYQNKDDPRCFKVDTAYEYESWMTGVKSWYVDGKYLEYDGKSFGLGDHQIFIQAFKGHKKITSLAAYPLKYHKDPEGIKKQLISRGMKFVALQGMNYRLQKGIAYMKHKNSIIRFIINGRVMVDPAIFRRINPNYPLSYLKQDELAQNEEEEDEDDDDDCCCESDEEEKNEEKDKMRIVMWKDKKGKKHPIRVPQSVVDKEKGEGTGQQLSGDEDVSETKRHVFTEEELLIASPVVLGFAFSEKLWLEFSLSGIDEIKWNAEAFSSLVLPSQIKQNLKGLVSSHRFNAAKTIDDVIQGKGKGLNVVLHGPPGVGKTLTGESIAEYLKCPLYAVSAGELGTNSRSLETDLNRIMDITHSWGAILLLDEADVFLEARQPHDIHRNSLVSVFLRLTEYYQGILFLTTNRVETFDEAFQSRIHMGIRYDNLPAKARKKIWQHHVGKVEKMSREAEAEADKKGGTTKKEEKDKDEKEVKPFTDADFDELSKRNMNGRQIKNTVKTSQSIALAEKSVFSMEYVKRVLDVAEAFEDDMRGGKGYRDAMRQYT